MTRGCTARSAIVILAAVHSNARTGSAGSTGRRIGRGDSPGGKALLLSARHIDEPLKYSQKSLGLWTRISVEEVRGQTEITHYANLKNEEAVVDYRTKNRIHITMSEG